MKPMFKRLAVVLVGLLLGSAAFAAQPSQGAANLARYWNANRPSLKLNFCAGDASKISETRASTATYTNAAGTIATASTNIPRITYDSSGNCLGLLVEEQRTNIALQSQAFDSGNWGKNSVSVTADGVTAPDGTVTGDLFYEDTSNAIHRLNQSFTLTSSQAYAFTLYAKASGSRRLLFNVNTAANAEALFDLTGSGSVVATSGSATNLAASIVAVANGWYKLTMYGTGTGVLNQWWLQLTRSSQSTTADDTYTGDGSSGVYVWGAQLEAGSTATSYIPTTSATVTRSADVASIATGSWFNAGQGTLYAAWTYTGTDGGAGSRNIANLNDNTYSNDIRLYLYDNYVTGGSVLTGGVSQADVQVTSPNLVLGSTYKTALAYSTNDFQFARNGALGAQDVSGTVPSGITKMDVGTWKTGPYFNSPIASIRYYPRRLPDSQLQALTR